MRKMEALFAFAVICALTGCGGGGGSAIVPPPPSALACAPSVQTVNAGAAAHFSAANGNGTYSWSAPGGNPASGSGASFSTQYASSGSDTVTVRSGSESASCAVTVNPAAISVAISPKGAAVQSGGTVQFLATVAGTTNTLVTWSASAGTVKSENLNALFTAPQVTAQMSVTVTATSVADPAQSANATVAVNPVEATFFAPHGTDDSGFRMLRAGSSLFGSDAPASTATVEAGMAEFGTDLSVRNSWTTAGIDATIFSVADDAADFYAVGTKGSDPATEQAVLFEFAKGAPFPPAEFDFMLGGKRTRGYGVAVSADRIYLGVRTDDIVCGMAFSSCDGDRIIVLDKSTKAILNTFPVGNTPDMKVADKTELTGIALYPDGGSLIVTGNRFRSDGTPVGDYGARYAVDGSLLVHPWAGGGVNDLPIFDKEGHLYAVSTFEVPGTTNTQMIALLLDPATLVAKFAPRWDGNNSGPVSVNNAFGIFPNPQGGVVIVGTLSKLGSSDANQTDGGAWAVDLTKCTASGCANATLWQKRVNVVSGGAVSALNSGAFGASGNLFLYGTGSDGRTSCGQASCTQVVLVKNP